MKVGILESRDDLFILDVVSRLKEVTVEFLSFQQCSVPVSGDYRVIVDRRSFRYPFLREILKNLALGGTYIINNPFAASLTNKMVDSKICSVLGIPSPRTMVLPDALVQEEFAEAVTEPSWERIAEEIGFPCVVKPFDGYAWQEVHILHSLEELQKMYDSLKARYILLVQQWIKYKDYYRAFCFNKREVLFVKWIPRPFALGEYLYSDLKPLDLLKDLLTHYTVELNSSLDLDINVVEWCIDQEGQAWMIDAYNEVPDVDRRQVPEPCYTGIVEKFAECIEQKLNSTERNRAVFALPEGEGTSFPVSHILNSSSVGETSDKVAS